MNRNLQRGLGINRFSPYVGNMNAHKQMHGKQDGCNPCRVTNPRICTCANQCANTKYGEIPIAMAYVPWQEWTVPVCPCEALQIGTIFNELNLPFLCDSPKGRCCIGS